MLASFSTGLFDARPLGLEDGIDVSRVRRLRALLGQGMDRAKAEERTF